jgi:hypothetical protein
VQVLEIIGGHARDRELACARFLRTALEQAGLEGEWVQACRESPGYRWRSRQGAAEGPYVMPSGMNPSAASRPGSVPPGDFANGIHLF